MTTNTTTIETLFPFKAIANQPDHSCYNRFYNLAAAFSHPILTEKIPVGFQCVLATIGISETELGIEIISCNKNTDPDDGYKLDQIYVVANLVDSISESEKAVYSIGENTFLFIDAESADLCVTSATSLDITDTVGLTSIRKQIDEILESVDIAYPLELKPNLKEMLDAFHSPGNISIEEFIADDLRLESITESAG